MDTNIQPMSLEDGVHQFRKEIDKLIVRAKAMSEQRLGKGGAEATLAYRSLQLAKMWLGKVLEENGSELPVEFQDKAGA